MSAAVVESFARVGPTPLLAAGVLPCDRCATPALFWVGVEDAASGALASDVVGHVCAEHLAAAVAEVVAPVEIGGAA